MTPPSSSPWLPLRGRMFRHLFLAATVSNVDTWMQNVAAAWEMTRQSASPLPRDAVQRAGASVGLTG